jgi:hypothetical protein
MSKKILLLLILIEVLFACSGVKNKTLNRKAKALDITISEIDSLSFDLYYLIHFQRENILIQGVLLVTKTEVHSFRVGEEASVKLCDIRQFKTVPVSDEFVNEKDSLIGGIDTLTYAGHFMDNGKIYFDEKLILDFSDDAKDPVFKVCK